MKRFLLLTLLSFSSVFIYAQTIEQIRADRQNYIWGEGSGVTLNRADQDALGMLINQISAQVESRFTLLQEELRTAGKDEFKETFKGVINTYSSATLRNTERIVVSNEPDAKIFRYIRRSDVDKIFADRERKIIEFAKSAQESEQNGRVADALRYYYWSLTLLRSHPNASNISTTDSKGQNRLLVSWLPMQLNNIFGDISIAVGESKKESSLTSYILNISYKNQPIRNFDYCYWTGRDWTNVYSAKDGLGIAEFTSETPFSEIRFKAEYVFEGETAIDHELRDVMGKLDVVPFRSSYFTTQVGKMQPPPLPKVIATNVTAVVYSAPYETSMKNLIDAVRSGNYQSAQSIFTPEGFEMYQKILQYGKARIIRDPELKYIQFDDGVMCRSLPMSFQFQNNNRTFIEDVVFFFNKDKKISNLSFGLSQVALNDIIGNPVWSERVRMVVVNFLENYKTAYALKRLDYIESIFADNALIIVGSVLKAKTTGDNPYLKNDIVKYNRFTKEQYINKLRHSFASNEFINIRFEDNIVRRSGRGGDVYGIQIKQDYFSSNYGDTGYLFLLVDLNNADQPVIHVRTWQPNKKDDGSIYGLGDF
jgi:hypothetical protein